MTGSWDSQNRMLLMYCIKYTFRIQLIYSGGYSHPSTEYTYDESDLVCGGSGTESREFHVIIASLNAHKSIKTTSKLFQRFCEVMHKHG